MTTFTWIPDFQSEVQFKPRVRSAAFGDGYEQRVGWGINTNPASWKLTFRARQDSEASAIDAFLAAAAGVASFTWTPPGGTALKWRCETWSKRPIAGNGTVASPAYIWDVTAEFMQVFEP